MNRTTLKSTLLAILGALAVVGPQLLNLLADMKSPKAALIASMVGFVVALAVNGKGVALVNAFLPDKPVVQPGTDAVTKPETMPPKDKGFTLIPLLLFFAAVTASLAVTFPAHGQALDPSTGLPKVMLEDHIPTPQLGVKWGRWTTQPATAAGFQVNLKTGDYERIAIMAGYGATYHGRQVTIGAVAFAGVGLSANAPNAPQASLLLTLWDSVAIGPGVTIFKGSGGDRIFQGLLTFAFNMTTGSTTEGLKGFMDVARVCAM
jgi:hypothetical protein